SPPIFVPSVSVPVAQFAVPPSTSSPRPRSSSSPSQPQVSTSPTSHVSQIFQSIVRTITIPRNRSRTNSTSASSPTSAHANVHVHGPTSPVQGSGAEVFGKTLVMTPSPMFHSELGPLSEIDGELLADG